MNNPPQPPAARVALRRAAVARLQSRRAPRGPKSPTDLRRVCHELEVHQVELELQNEELRAAQAESAAALARYTDLYDFAPVSYFTLTASGTIRLVTLTGARLVGVTRGRLVGQSFGPLVADASRRTFGDFLARVFAGETKQTCDLTLAKTVAGSPMIVQLEATLSPDRTECRALIVDITKRQRAEEQLKMSLAQVGELKQALDEHAIVAITDPRGMITFVNDKFCAISQYSRAELLGQDHRLINSGHHSREFMRDLWATIGRGQVWHGEIRNRAKDGSFYWMATTIVPFLDQRGKPQQYVSIRADITAHKESESRFRQLVDSNAQGVMIWNTKGEITEANDAFLRLMGYTREDLKARRINWAAMTPPEGDALDRQGLKELAATGVCRSYEKECIRKDGSRVPILIGAASFQACPDEGVSFVIDNSERKQAEAKLRELGTQLNRAEEYERRRIARELHDSTGQKLAALSITVGLLQDALLPPSDVTGKILADSLTLIEECAQEIRTLSYLLHPPLLDELGLAAAIANYVAGFTRRSSVRVRFEPPPDFARLPEAVEMALFRVVQESLGNILRHARTLAARIRLVADAEQVTLEIRDSGVGMSAKTLRAINAQLSSPGVGIVGMRERLRLVGGLLEIKSNIRGTTVRAIVPRTQ